jgi:hypothetical protein
MRGRTTQKRVVDKQASGVLGDLGGHHHALAIGGKRHRLDQADVDVLELDLGLAGLQALAGLEADGDRRSLFDHGLHREPAADQHGNDWHEPYELQAPARARWRLGDGLGEVRGIGVLAWTGHG